MVRIKIDIYDFILFLFRSASFPYFSCGLNRTIVGLTRTYVSMISKVVSFISLHVEVIKFVSGLRQLGGFYHDPLVHR